MAKKKLKMLSMGKYILIAIVFLVVGYLISNYLQVSPQECPKTSVPYCTLFFYHGTELLGTAVFPSSSVTSGSMCSYFNGWIGSADTAKGMFCEPSGGPYNNIDCNV